MTKPEPTNLENERVNSLTSSNTATSNPQGCYLPAKLTKSGGAPLSPERPAAGSISFNAVNCMPSILSSNAAELNDFL